VQQLLAAENRWQRARRAALAAHRALYRAIPSAGARARSGARILQLALMRPAPTAPEPPPRAVGAAAASRAVAAQAAAAGGDEAAAGGGGGGGGGGGSGGGGGGERPQSPSSQRPDLESAVATTAAAAAEAHARLHAALNWQLGGAAAAQAEALRLEARLVWALLRAARAASAAEGGDNQLAGGTVLSVPRPPCAAADEVAGLPAALEHAVGWLRATPKLCEGVDALGVRLVLLRQALSLVATHGLGLGLGLGLGGEAGRRLEGETIGGPRHVAMLDAGEGALREAARRVAAEREAAAEEARREAAAAAAAAEEAAAAAGKPKPKARGQAAPPPPDHGALVWRSAFEISELVYSLQVEAEEGARLGAAQAHQLLYKLGPMEADAAAAAAAAAEASTDAPPLEQQRARRSRRPSSERDVSPVTPRAIGSAGASSVASAQSGQRPAVSSAQAL